MIVLTTGVFDILHVGHISTLKSCRNLSVSSGLDFWFNNEERVIVLMDTDERVAKTKGKDRPINNFYDRKEVLMSLRTVDEVRGFRTEEEKNHWISYIKPHYFVKGGDYTLETVKERSLVESLGGEIKIVPYLRGFSTTKIVEKMRKS